MLSISREETRKVSSMYGRPEMADYVITVMRTVTLTVSLRYQLPAWGWTDGLRITPRCVPRYSLLHTLATKIKHW